MDRNLVDPTRARKRSRRRSRSASDVLRGRPAGVSHREPSRSGAGTGKRRDVTIRLLYFSFAAASSGLTSGQSGAAAAGMSLPVLREISQETWIIEPEAAGGDSSTSTAVDLLEEVFATSTTTSSQPWV